VLPSCIVIKEKVMLENLKMAEFNKRIQEVAKARKIFIPHITKNITIAFTLYQEVLADDKIEVMIKKSDTPFGNITRPVCDECGKPLGLKIKALDQNGKTWPTAWVCECGLEYYSEKSAQDWYEELHVSEKTKGNASD